MDWQGGRHFVENAAKGDDIDIGQEESSRMGGRKLSENVLVKAFRFQERVLSLRQSSYAR